jgi:Cd2+/Zn2+-exporting ATPase
MVSQRAIRSTSNLDPGLDKSPLESLAALLEYSALALASAVEQRSEHPLAQAVLRESSSRGVQGRYTAADGVTALAGRGVTGKVNGQQITIGSHAYFEANILHAEYCDEVAQAAEQGLTTMLISADSDYVGYITVADKVRQSSQAAVAALKRLGIQALVMLTGDNEAPARHIAQQVGVTDVRATCANCRLPLDSAGRRCAPFM